MSPDPGGRSTMTRSASPASTVQADPTTSSRVPIQTPLRDVDIAPENLRFGEPPDEDIPLLAETLLAAGQLQPLTTRPGRKKERGHMALDGRRRLLAFRLLLDQGRIADDHPIDMFVETDPARQAAADVGLYQAHRLARIALPDARPHPSPLVESGPMASVSPPAPTYRPTLPPALRDEGRISDAQTETVIYAGEAHAGYLPAWWSRGSG